MTFKDLLDVAKEELKALTDVPKPDFRLEEAEYDHDKKAWNIVVSFLVENTNKRMIPAGTLLNDFQYHRVYKKLRINDHKEVTGLFIYNS